MERLRHLVCLGGLGDNVSAGLLGHADKTAWLSALWLIRARWDGYESKSILRVHIGHTGSVMDDETFDAAIGGPLAYWDLAESMSAVQGSLDLAHAQLDRLRAGLRIPNLESDEFVNLAESELFLHAAYSNMVAGALGPLVETLLKRAASRLRKIPNWEPTKHVRWQLTETKFWDPAFLREADGKTINVGRELGLSQILHALAIPEPTLDAAIDAFHAFRDYRNASLHNALEWEIVDLKSFQASISGPREKWFDVCTIGGVPWMISLTDEFIEVLQVHVDSVAKSLRDLIRRRTGKRFDTGSG